MSLAGALLYHYPRDGQTQYRNSLVIMDAPRSDVRLWAGSGQSAFNGDGGLAAEDVGLRAMAAPDAIAEMQWGIASLRSALIELRSTHSSQVLVSSSRN